MLHKYIKYILTSFWMLWVIISLFIYKDYITPSQDTWLSNMIWYQIIPDRWSNGNVDNDATTRPLDRNGIPNLSYSGTTLRNAWLLSWMSTWTQDRFILTDVEQKIAQSYSKNNSITPAFAKSSVLRNRRFGGDFQGIQNKIPYLHDLWIDTVLLHPIWLSDSSMRYDVKDWRHIDPRLTNEFDNKIHSYTDYIWSWYADTWDFTQSDKEFFQLLQSFHNKWMKVVLDMSLLYASSASYIIKDIASSWKQSSYYDRFDFVDKQYKNDYQSCSLSFFYDSKIYPWVDNIYYQWWWWDCSKIYIRRWVGEKSIPDWLYEYYLKIMERRLWSHMIDNTLYQWADGVRVDAAGEFPHNFLNLLYKDIKKINPNAIVMLEERSADTDSIQYSRADTMSFYPIRLWAEALILQQGRGLIEGISSLTKRIEQFYRIIPIKANVLMNYLWSHDTDRILSRIIYSNKDLAVAYFRQDGTNVLWKQGHFARDAPWISRTDHNARYIHTQPYQSDIHLLKWLIWFQFIMPGSPVIYYGDEVWMYGADDPDNRQPMRWNIDDHFPRHICKKGEIWEDYCYTDGSMEEYRSDPTIIDWYKKLITLKKESPALQQGSVSMNICYIKNWVSSCTHNDKKNHPIRWLYREYNSDHLLYLSKGEENFSQLQIQTNIPNTSRKNILNDTIVESDGDGFIDVSDVLNKDGYLILRSTSSWWKL